MKKILMFVLLQSCGWGWTCLDEFSAGGMGFCLTYEPEEEPRLIEWVVEEVEKQTQVYYPEVKNLREKLEKHNIQVIVREERLYMDCSQEPAPWNIDSSLWECDRSVTGIYYNDRSLIVLANWSQGPCFNKLSLAHELLHGVEVFYNLAEVSTSLHATPMMFSQYYRGDGSDREVKTIESRVFQAGFDKCD